jgi:hypothetical protein
MPKDTFVKKQNGVNLRLKEIQAPLQKIAFSMDRSLNWLVCKMLKDHELLKDFLQKNPHLKNKQ